LLALSAVGDGERGGEVVDKSGGKRRRRATPVTWIGIKASNGGNMALLWREVMKGKG
jgi:hypothetical protein